MAGRIPDNFIQDLLARTDIVELVSQRVTLKKSGRNYMACCPFHQEKTPSFTVAPDKQFYYCFGCGASGNAIGFLMEYEHQSFPQAVEQLAALSGLDVPKEQLTPQQQARLGKLEQLYRVLERADQYYRRQLRSAPEKDSAIRYLKQRGLSGQIAARYGIGFAPPGFENLLSALSLDHDGIAQAIEAGLLIRREDSGRVYDKFRNRIMFPIRDPRGRIVGFGGRVLGDDKPKYLNSPETPVFHKGRELYGLWEIRQSRQSPDRLFVVEGYMDVIAMAQHGIENAVATLGTATSQDHVQKLFQQVDEIIFCFDGDQAGRRAAWRALESSLPRLEDGKQARFLFLPEGEDPDSMVRHHGPEHLLAMANHAPALVEYFLTHLSDGLNLNTVEGRVKLAKLALPYLPKIKGIAYQSLIRQELSEKTRLARSDLDRLEAASTLSPQTDTAPSAAAEQAGANTMPDAPPPVSAVPEHHHSFPDDIPPPDDDPGAATALEDNMHPAGRGRTHLTLAESLIGMLLHRPALLNTNPLPAALSQLKMHHLPLLIKVADYLVAHPGTPHPVLLSGLMAMPESEQLTHILNRSTRIKDDETALQSWEDALTRLHILIIEQQIDQQHQQPNLDIHALAALHHQLNVAKQRLDRSLTKSDTHNQS